jgi:hypothetical protein
LFARYCLDCQRVDFSHHLLYICEVSG